MKKETKNTNNLGVCVAGCSRSQKIWGVIALAGLFACGWMVGVSVNALRADAAADVAVAEEAPVVPLVETPRRNCEIVEELLWERVGSHISTNDTDAETAFLNMMYNNGCPENRDAYQQKLNALGMVKKFENVMAKDSANTQNPGRTCTKIEQEVSGQLCNNCPDAEGHIQNAKVYAKLSERGCPENSEKYVALARQELELARALRDDEFSDYDTIDVVETYKRLHMQAAAEDVINKVKKLTNPAIDFILELEKIINE